MYYYLNYIVAIVIITPKLGVGLTIGLILIGQLCVASALDHFCAFGNPQHTLGAGRAVGRAMMVAGIVAIKTY